MDEIVEALEELGMPVEQLHAESAHGQFEVVTTHDDPLQVGAMHMHLHPARVVGRQTICPDGTDLSSCEEFANPFNQPINLNR